MKNGNHIALMIDADHNQAAMIGVERTGICLLLLGARKPLEASS